VYTVLVLIAGATFDHWGVILFQQSGDAFSHVYVEFIKCFYMFRNYSSLVNNTMKVYWGRGDMQM
jgi:hypothetical protein